MLLLPSPGQPCGRTGLAVIPISTASGMCAPLAGLDRHSTVGWPRPVPRHMAPLRCAADGHCSAAHGLPGRLVAPAAGQRAHRHRHHVPVRRGGGRRDCVPQLDRPAGEEWVHDMCSSSRGACTTAPQSRSQGRCCGGVTGALPMCVNHMVLRPFSAAVGRFAVMCSGTAMLQ